jgi:SnoaL-like domain
MVKADGFAERLAAVEDRLAILNLLAGSAHSSDVASASFWEAMLDEKAVMDRGSGRPEDVGKENILAIVQSPEQHSAIDAGMAHLAQLPYVTVDGNQAVATGYILVVMPDSNASRVTLPGKGTSPGISIYQLTVNRWELIRTPVGWKVSRRVVRPLASPDARQILADGIKRVT